MEKQLVITVRGGAVQHIAANFDCSYQIVDYDNEPDHVGDILEPDTIEKDKDIFVED